MPFLLTITSPNEFFEAITAGEFSEHLNKLIKFQ